MKGNNKRKHYDSTILKHYSLYQDYKELRKTTKEKYPEVADFIGQSYYYNVLSKKYNLIRNYVCVIICSISADEERYKKDVFLAELNLKS